MILAPCLVCGEPTQGSRCPVHARPDAKGSARTRGYDARWDALSRRARAAQPWCSDCGATTDLQTDHTPQAWERKAAGKVLRLVDIDVVCGPCNRARGAARGGNPRPPSSGPSPQAKSATQTPTQHSSRRSER